MPGCVVIYFHPFLHLYFIACTPDLAMPNCINTCCVGSGLFMLCLIFTETKCCIKLNQLRRQWYLESIKLVRCMFEARHLWLRPESFLKSRVGLGLEVHYSPGLLFLRICIWMALQLSFLLVTYHMHVCVSLHLLVVWFV